MESIRADVLGPVALWRGDERIDLSAGKVRALVAMLALRPNRAVATSTIIDGLWGDDPPNSATNAVQVYVSTVRRGLRAAGAPDARVALASSAAGYALAVAADAVDAVRFEVLANEGFDLLQGGDAAAADIRLRAAAGCWSGDRALADVDEPFADPIRTRLDELRLMVREHHVDARLVLGANAELVPELESLVAAYPYRESVWERLMVALYRAGRQADALAAYDRARAILIDELGLEPGPSLARLQTAVLRQDAELGQVGPSTAPSPTKPARRRRQVPTATTAPSAHVVLGLASLPGTLVGRESDLSTLRTAIGKGGARLVTLTGPGGVGKTRLAVAVATEALAVGDLVVFVDLATATDAEAVATSLAATLQLDPGGDAVASIAGHLEGRRTLAVLDNLEQVRGAAHAVGDLLARVPSLSVLATSRSALRLAVEHEQRVRPLAIDDARALFLSRAQVDRTDLAHIEADPSLTRLCSRLDCLPLAIELAAARARLLPLPALEAQLDRLGLAALGRGQADAPERHQTLDATVAWSVDLLGTVAAEVYDVLGCFAGGASLEAVEAVAGVTDPTQLLDALDLLIDVSLVPPPDLSARLPRFRMLETIRQHATRRAEARSDVASLHQRHFDHYAHAAHRGGVIDVDDLPNVRLAVDRALAGGRAEEAADLVIEARRLWFDTGALTEFRELSSRILESELAVLTRSRMDILFASFAYLIDGSEETERLLSAIATLRAAGSRDPLAINAFCYLGSMALDRGDPAAADAYGSEAVEWASGVDLQGESMALDFRAYVARRQGDAARAAEILGRAVELAREDPPAALAQRLASFALALCAAGAFDDALAPATESLRIAREIDARPSERDALVALGEAVRPTDPAAAVAHLTHAVAMTFELGQEGIEELTRLARALFDHGDARVAALVAGVVTARRTAKGLDDPEGEAIMAELSAQLDAATMAAGAALDRDAVDRLVRGLTTSTAEGQRGVAS